MMSRDVPALLAAGVLLACLELVWVLVFGRSLFLSDSERAAYAAVALTGVPALVFAAGLVLRPVLRPDRAGSRWRALFAVAAGASATWAAYLLTEGRRARELSLRPVLVLVLGTGVALATLYAAQLASKVRHGTSRHARIVWSSGCAGACLAALLLDVLVLPRSYPAFHIALTVFAWLTAALGGLVWCGAAAPRVVIGSSALAGACVLTAPLSLAHLADQPNASYAVRQRAPWSSKLLLLEDSRHARSEHKVAALVEHETATTQARGIDLRDQDVLLITVDALRADLLGAYGGKGLTPELDRLAQESVVFRRAYTPAPHTSYALSSLLTSKFIKPVLELPGAANDHVTVPDLLRRYGYRTAAFYPPAIFFVDGARFDALRSRGFGFEYRKEMYAPANQRVQQLESYLAEAEPGHPLFVWVHLFEPHEPYEPPPELVREESARGRYEGEVIVCDRAIGKLVRAFRDKKPNATVIVTADHGEELGDHGGHYHGTTLYDEQVRIPLLWSSPGVVAPAVVDTPVELADVGTTLLSAAGIPRDARMRGDDLGGVLAGNPEAGPRFGFASVEDKHMVTDGRLKAMCSASEAHCQLFDLREDPQEMRNLAGDRPSDVDRLRTELDGFLSSIPKVEAMAVGDGVGWPEALARAKLGAPGAGPLVIPLLGDSRAAVRAAAARALGELMVSSSLPLIDRIRLADDDSAVRAEASISALLLGADAAADDVVKLLTSGSDDGDGLAQARRAALALARVKRVEAVSVLCALALDEQAQESDRLRAIAALGQIGSLQASDTLVRLLDDVRLRVAVSDALSSIGGKPAADALAKQLAHERYQPARRAEALALHKLNDRRTLPLVTRMLGMETSIPDGVRILVERKALSNASARGALLTQPSVRAGSWTCDAAACSPGEGAEIVLPANHAVRTPVRVNLLVTQAEPGATFVIDGEPHVVKFGDDQLSFERASGRDALRFKIALQGKAALSAIAVVPVVPDIPPPAPEPWDSGVPQVAAP